MRNFQDTFETPKRSFINTFSICVTVPLRTLPDGCFCTNITAFLVWSLQFQKQPLRSVLRKRCSENMQQIYRGTPTPKCDFNKVALETLLKSHFGMDVLL